MIDGFVPMRSIMKKILHLLSSSKLAVLLLVYLGAFVALATFVPQAGMGIESPLAHIVDIPVVATVLRTLAFNYVSV